MEELRDVLLDVALGDRFREGQREHVLRAHDLVEPLGLRDAFLEITGEVVDLLVVIETELVGVDRDRGDLLGVLLGSSLFCNVGKP